MTTLKEHKTRYTRVTFELEDELYEWLQEEAKVRKISVSQVMTEILRTALAKLRQEKETLA